MLLDFSAGTVVQGLREGGTPSTELEGPRPQKDLNLWTTLDLLGSP